MVDVTTLEGVVLGLWIFFRWSINRFGGWQIAYYRLRGIAYHQIYIHLSSSKFDRFAMRDDKMENLSPIIAFERHGGNYILGGNEEMFLNPYGAPSFEYQWNDSRPMKVNMSVPMDQRCDARLIHAGLHNKVIAEFHGLNKKGSIARNGAIFAVVLLSMMIGFLTLYYSYNTACAVHSLACVGSHP
jgi:hypothetical protein